VAIASNESFSGWTKTFTDPRLCAAIVDRLTFGGNIIETGTVSYRLAHARAHRAGSTADRPGVVEPQVSLECSNEDFQKGPYCSSSFWPASAGRLLAPQ